MLLAAAIWGGGFVAQRLGMQHVGPMTFNAIRFALGAAALVPVILWQRRNVRRDTNRPCRGANSALCAGLLAGSVLFVAASLQQYGLVYTTAGKAGFITGLYVVLVPVLGLSVGVQTRLATWIGVILAAVGLYFLSVQAGFTINRGDLLVLACAVGWAVHVLLIGRLAPRCDPIRLAAVQFTHTAFLSALVAVLTESINLTDIHAAGGAILYGGLCSVGIAYTLQVVGQRHAPPAHAALLLSGEAIFAAAGGWWLLDETLSSRELAGCVFMLAGIVVSQLRRR